MPETQRLRKAKNTRSKVQKPNSKLRLSSLDLVFCFLVICLNASSSDQSQQDCNDCYNKKDVNDTSNAEHKCPEYPSNDKDHG